MIHFITDIALKHLPQEEVCLELSEEGCTYGWKILQAAKEEFQQDEV